MDAGRALSDALPDSEIKEALFILERLRAVKSPAELAKLQSPNVRRQRIRSCREIDVAGL